MKGYLLIGGMALALTYLLLRLRQWLISPQVALSRRQPVYLVRIDDDTWDFETAQQVHPETRTGQIRIKLPTVVIGGKAGSNGLKAAAARGGSSGLNDQSVR